MVKEDVETVENIDFKLQYFDFKKNNSIEKLLEVFSDMEESFNEELKQIGTNSLTLVNIQESEKVVLDIDLYKELVHILEDVFKIYISTENLEGFLSVETTKQDKIYLTNFYELETSINSIIKRINNVMNYNFIKNNGYVPIVKAKENLANSINSLEYFLKYFKIVHEKLIEK